MVDLPRCGWLCFNQSLVLLQAFIDISDECRSEETAVNEEYEVELL